jgi:cold shock CspA family protein
MKAGLIKWFDNDKGFGLVGTPNNEDYFLHAKSF